MMNILGQIRFEREGSGDPVGILDNAVLDEWRIPFGYWFDQMVDWMDINAGWVLDTIPFCLQFPGFGLFFSLWFSGLFSVHQE